MSSNLHDLPRHHRKYLHLNFGRYTIRIKISSSQQLLSVSGKHIKNIEISRKISISQHSGGTKETKFSLAALAIVTKPSGIGKVYWDILGHCTSISVYSVLTQPDKDQESLCGCVKSSERKALQRGINLHLWLDSHEAIKVMKYATARHEYDLACWIQMRHNMPHYFTMKLQVTTRNVLACSTMVSARLTRSCTSKKHPQDSEFVFSKFFHFIFWTFFVHFHKVFHLHIS